MPNYPFIFLLMIVALGVAILAKRMDQPYPIALVVAGIAIGLLPEAPQIHLDPELVFYILLPPILGEAAYFTDLQEFNRFRRPILLLAFGLVATTSAVVAAIVVWLVPGMSWAAGFTLGAIVSPPDAAAATAITRGLGLPRRVVQILEGESLVNDAAGLTLYRFAVAAAATGAFSYADVLLSFLWTVLGGVGIGFLVGYAYIRIFPYIKDVEGEVLSTFLIGFTSYVLAETVHASGVLSVVTASLILSYHAPRLFSATTRIRGYAVWQSVIFLLNCAIFLLLGYRMPTALATVSHYPLPALLTLVGAVLAGVIIIRLLWVYPGAYLPRLLSRHIREQEQPPHPKAVFVIGWTGLRGIVSLAAVEALPANFPHRDLLLVLTFAVILGTLLLQGLTLRPLIKALRLPKEDCTQGELLEARVFAAERGLGRLLELESTAAAPPKVFARVRSFFEDRLFDLRAQLEVLESNEEVQQPEQFQTVAEQRLWWEIARAERAAIGEMRRTHAYSEEALREIESDIDLLEARITPK